MEYRCVTTSVEGFVQQLAVAYITHGYWFYVAGKIPEGKEPAAVDAKLIERYGIAITKWARCRRKKQGLANMQYLRHERFFVLLATKGRHEFFERERVSFRDVRRVPIKFAGYSIGCRTGRDGRWHASVRFDRERYRELKALFEDRSTRESVADLVSSFGDLKALAYAPVERQFVSIARSVNSCRRIAGLEPLDDALVKFRRTIVRPFLAASLAERAYLVAAACPRTEYEAANP